MSKRRNAEQIVRLLREADRDMAKGLTVVSPWVRGLARVQTRVWTMLFINAARISHNKDLRHS